MKPSRIVKSLAMLLVMAALPAQFASAAEKPKVALVMKSLANEFFQTMGTDHNEVAILDASGIQRLPLMPKTEVAHAIVEHLAHCLTQQPHQ